MKRVGRILVSGAADAYKFQPLITSADLMQSGEIIPNNYFDGQASQNKGLDGPLDITNGLNLSLSGNGTALFFRMLTQAENPTRTALDGSSYGSRTPVTPANAASLGTNGSTTDLSATMAAPATDAPVRLTLSLSMCSTS